MGLSSKPSRCAKERTDGAADQNGERKHKEGDERARAQAQLFDGHQEIGDAGNEKGDRNHANEDANGKEASLL